MLCPPPSDKTETAGAGGTFSRRLSLRGGQMVSRPAPGGSRPGWRCAMLGPGILSTGIRVKDDGRIAVNDEQRNIMASGRGFIAALDQSGGSSPKALKLYGIEESAYDGDEQMFDLIHQMRSRLITSPSFTGDKLIATILFEQTMDRAIEGEESAAFLWK